MNRKNQITKDFALLLDDGRLKFANVSQNASVTSFDIVLKKPVRVINSDGTTAGHWRMDFDLVASVTLENDYSNIIESAADVLSRHPYRNDAPLIRLRRSTLSGKARYTLGITDSGNLEFFGCKNYKCSDDLGAALWSAIVPDAVQLIGHYTPAYISTFKRADEYHLRLILDKDADK